MKIRLVIIFFIFILYFFFINTPSIHKIVKVNFFTMSEIINSRRLRPLCEDLEQNSSLEIPLRAPFNDDMTLQQKVQSTYRALLRACRIRDRVLILVNAYYLGQLLETESTNPSERMMLRNMVTIYYRLGITRIYYLFEFLGVE